MILTNLFNLTKELWISQISGLIGLIVIGISYLFPKKKFLAIATISFVFFIIEQFFARVYSNLIVSSVCFLRNLLMTIFMLKKNKELPKKILFSLLLIMWISEIIYMAISKTFFVLDNYLPPVIVTMSTFTQNSKNEYIVKIGVTLHETGFLIYYLIYKLPISIFRQVVLVVSSLIGIIIFYKKTKQKNEEKNSCDKIASIDK